MPITGKQLSTTSAVTIFTLLLILTTVNSVHSILQQESNILSMGIVQYDDFQSSVIWQSGAESGDFSAWDAIDSSSIEGITISNTEVHGKSRSIKFYIADGNKNDDDRRLGLFIHDVESVYQTGFYLSYWVYFPSNIEDMIDKSYNWLTIGGLKWYFYKYRWSFGARWALQWNNGKIRVRLHIGGHMNSWSDIDYGAWNHFQIYLKSKTDPTGAWQAWVNDISLGSLTNVKSHPNAFLTPNQGTDFFSQHNLSPHPQVMYYVDYNAASGHLYVDDCVIATEKVPENYRAGEDFDAR